MSDAVSVNLATSNDGREFRLLHSGTSNVDVEDHLETLSDLSDLSDLDDETLQALRERRENKTITWENLTIWDKLALYNKWQILCLLANICSFFGSLIYVLPLGQDIASTEILIGLGCGLNWISLTRYFEHDRQYSLIVRTLKRAVPTNVKIMLGILPIFIGYTLFVMTIFWSYRSHTSNFSDTGYMLFCMMNGDSILNTFQTLTLQYNIIAQFFGFTFTFMAICVWQNMNIVSVEDSYLNVKYKETYSWLKGNEGAEPTEESNEPSQPAP